MRPADIPEELLVLAGDWIADCAWRDLEPEEIAELDATTIRRGIARYYAGGWAQFLIDCDYEPETPALIIETGPRGRVSSLARAETLA